MAIHAVYRSQQSAGNVTSSNVSTPQLAKFLLALMWVMLCLTAARAALGVARGFGIGDAGSVAAGLGMAALLKSTLDGHRRLLWLVMGACGVTVAWASWILTH